MRFMRMAIVVLALSLGIVLVMKKMPGAPLHVVSRDDLRTHYLLDYDYQFDAATGEATMGHLVVLNPGEVDARLDVTAYFETREPESFELAAPAKASVESNYEDWPVEVGERFALEIHSSVPVICQATVGWNNSSNDYDFDAQTPSSQRRREAAKSYVSTSSLASQWYLADGYIIEKPGRSWVDEFEWAILLNPHAEALDVSMTLHWWGEESTQTIRVPARRVRWLDMRELAPHNRHYGARFTAEGDFAAQWLRSVYWSGSSELMTYWSVPLVALDSNDEEAGR